MQLSKRLEKIIDLVTDVESIIDVGTDHGYVPCELLLRNKVKRAIASDINKMPLEKARMNARLQNVEDKMEFKLGSGLQVIHVGEVNAAVIAGVGGELTVDILEVSKHVVENLQYVILQPAQNPEVVRKYIYDKNFSILGEDLVREDDGRWYEYFKVKFNKEVLGFSHKEKDFDLSPILIKHKHPMLRDYIIDKMKETTKVIAKLDLNYPSSRIKERELKSRNNYYEEVLKWL